MVSFSSKQKALLLIALAAVFLAAFAATALFEDGTRAEPLPGTVAQTAVSSGGGVTVRAETAVFTGLAVDVWIKLASQDPTLELAGIAPADAVLGDSPGTSAAIGEGGLVVIRFPALRNLGSRATEVLTVSAVQAMREDGHVEQIPGSWRLQIALPSGASAARAEAVRAFPPQAVAVAGASMILEAFRTERAVVLRYVLPPGVVELTPPTLRVGNDVIAADQSISYGDRNEVWFEQSVPEDQPLKIVFDGLVGPRGNAGGRAFALALDPFTPPPQPQPVVTEERAVGWSLAAGDAGIVDVIWRRDIWGVSLLITLEGLWEPSITGKPVVLADGQELFVRGVALYPATQERGERTTIDVSLPDASAPGEVRVSLGGESGRLDPVEVVFTQ